MDFVFVRDTFVRLRLKMDKLIKVIKLVGILGGILFFILFVSTVFHSLICNCGH